MCWQQLTHFGSWLNDFWTTVSMSFPIDTSANNKVWIVLETHEWPSQVTKLCPITIHAKSNSHLLMKNLFNDIWENFSCLFSLFRHLYKYLCNFPCQITSSLYSNVTTSTRNKFFKCTYVHLCLVSFETIQYSTKSVSDIAGDWEKCHY